MSTNVCMKLQSRLSNKNGCWIFFTNFDVIRKIISSCNVKEWSGMDSLVINATVKSYDEPPMGDVWLRQTPKARFDEARGKSPSSENLYGNYCNINYIDRNYYIISWFYVSYATPLKKLTRVLINWLKRSVVVKSNSKSKARWTGERG